MRKKNRGGDPENSDDSSSLMNNIREELGTLSSRLLESPFIRRISTSIISNPSQIHLDILCVLAAKYGRIRLLELLLKAGANINPIYVYDTSLEDADENMLMLIEKSTPLQYAIQYNQTEAAEFLLDHGANPDIGNLLVLAIIEKNIDIANLLLKYKANPNIGDPLYVAFKKKHTELAKLLLERGADPNDGGTMDSFQLVIANGDTEMLNLLLVKGANPNASNAYGISMLTFAIRFAYRNRGAIIKLLLEKGADPNIEDGTGSTPLYSAIGFDQAEAVKIMMSSSIYTIDLEKQNKHGVSPMEFAVKKNSKGVIQLFKELGYSISTCSDYTTQITGTCYYNAVLNGILLSPRLLNLARFKFYKYIETLRVNPDHAITYDDVIDKRVHIQFAGKERSIFDKIMSFSKKELYRERTGEIIIKLSDIPDTATDRIIYLTQENRNEIAKFMVMKTIYLFMCDLDKLKTLRYQRKSCSRYIQDYIQLLATLTLYIQKPKSIIVKYREYDIAPVLGSKSIASSIPLYLSGGGFPFYTFKTVLKYIYDYKTEYRDKVQIKNIKNPPTIHPSCEVLILITPLYTEDVRQKKYKTRVVDVDPISTVHDFYKNSGGLKEEVMIENIRFVIDHVSIILLGRKGHAIVGTVCGTKQNPVYALVDSNDKIQEYDWRKIPFLSKEQQKDFIKQTGYDSYESYESVYLDYVCYVREDMNSLYPVVQEDVCVSKEQTSMAGGTMVSYKGRKYKVRVGKRGGKYILVGKEKNVVYLSGKKTTP